MVDLWGGVRDARDGSPWQEDTLVLVYSTSKGLSAMTLALAHSRGWLDYDERVTAYWPEFGQAGKEQVTLRQLLGHEAGLPVIDEPLDPWLVGDFDGLAAAIARQRPGELIRRVDPAHRTLGRFFAEDVAGPLGLEVYFGLPEDVAPERIARIERARPVSALPQLRHLPPRMVAGMLNPRSVTFRTFANPRLRNFADLDRSEYRRLEHPAGGAVGTARAIARATFTPACSSTVAWRPSPTRIGTLAPRSSCASSASGFSSTATTGSLSALSPWMMR